MRVTRIVLLLSCVLLVGCGTMLPQGSSTDNRKILLVHVSTWGGKTRTDLFCKASGYEKRVHSSYPAAPLTTGQYSSEDWIQVIADFQAADTYEDRGEPPPPGVSGWFGMTIHYDDGSLEEYDLRRYVSTSAPVRLANRLRNMCLPSRSKASSRGNM